MAWLNSIYFKLLVASGLALILYNESFVNHNKDFEIFVEAARLLAEGKNCYDVWLHSGESGLKYFYSPLFALLLFPVKDLPQPVYNLIWLSFNLFLIFRLFRLLPFFLPLKRLSQKTKQLFYFLVLLGSARFLYDSFCLGQMTVLLVWGSMEALRLFKLGHHTAGGALLALIINIKIIPIAVLGWLIYQNERKAVIHTLLFLTLYLFLPGLFLGFQFNNQLLAAWYKSLSNTSSQSIVDDYGRQGLSSFFAAWLMDTPLQFGLKRNPLNLDAATVQLLLQSGRLLLVLCVLLLLGKPGKRLPAGKALFYGLAMVSAAIPLFFPHQGKYSFFYLMPANAYCVFVLLRLYKLRQRAVFRKLFKKELWLLTASFGLSTLSTDGIIGRSASNFCEYFLFITFGAFFLLGAMALVKPRQQLAA